MSKILKIVGGLVILVVALVVAGVAVLKSQDLNAYRGALSEQVKAATGRDLTLAGDIKLDVSLNPSVYVEGVSFSNAPWGTRNDMAKVNLFEAKVKLLPMLSGNVEVSKLVLHGLEANLETNKDGVGNWVFSGGEQDASQMKSSSGGEGMSGLPVVRMVELRDIKITYKDGVSGETVSLELEGVNASSDGLDSPLLFDLTGFFNQQRIKAEGKLGAISALMDSARPWPVSVSMNAPGVTVKVDGSVAQPMQGKGLDLHLTVDAEDPVAAAKAAGVDIPPMPGVRLSGLLKDGGGGYSLEGLDAKIGSSDLKGRLAVALGGARPGLDATLTSQNINLPELLPKGSAAPAEPAGEGDGKVFPADPLPLQGLKAADVKLDFKAKSIKTGQIPVSDVALVVDLDNGHLNVPTLKAGVAGGTIEGRVTLDGGKSTPDLSLKVDSTGLDLGGLLKEFAGTDILVGHIDVKVDVIGKGSSVRALMAALDGKTSVIGKDGRINNEALETVSTGLLEAMPWAAKADANKINCIVSRFDIKGGMASSKALVFDTNGITVLGEGGLNLADETIDMTIETDAKSASLAALAIPVNVGGTFLEPSVAPNIGKTVENVVSGIVEAPSSLLGDALGGKTSETTEIAADVCARVLAGKPAKVKKARKQPESQTETESVVPAIPSGDELKKDLNNLGEGLKKGLGGLLGN